MIDVTRAEDGVVEHIGEQYVIRVTPCPIVPGTKCDFASCRTHILLRRGGELWVREDAKRIATMIDGRERPT